MSRLYRLMIPLVGGTIAVGCDPASGGLWFSPFGFTPPPGTVRKDVLLAGSNTPADTLQQAIDDLGPDGGILELPEGTFKLEHQVNLKSHVTLMGAPGKTVLLGGGRGALLAIQDATDVTIAQLVLDAADRNEISAVITGSTAQRLGIYQCEIRNTGQDANGIDLQKDVDGAQIIGNYVHDIGNSGNTWGTAITLGWDSSDATITDNRIDNCTRAGINAHNDCQNLYVARNDIRNLQGEGLGIELWNNCSGTVENNKVSSWISFDGASGSIQNNEVNGSWNSTPPSTASRSCTARR